MTRLFSLLLLVASTSAPAFAQSAPGGLLVAPTRVVFEGRTRSAELTLINAGTETATYRISMAHLRMTDSGEIREIAAPMPGEQFADDLVRFSPRQVVLQPGIAQTVRIQLRKPAALPAGEYRSHLMFKTVPAVAPIPELSGDAPRSGFSVELSVLYGVSIPVIVRHGETSAEARVSKLSLERPESGPVLKMRMGRIGNRSVYGNVVVTFAPADGKEQVVGQIRGVAVYAPNAHRAFEVPLRLPRGAALARGTLRVEYVDAERGLDPLAVAELSVP